MFAKGGPRPGYSWISIHRALATVTTVCWYFFFQAEDGIRDYKVTGVQTCALPIYFAARLDVQDIAFIPLSALTGANVVDRSREMPWYHGPTLLYHLETVHIASDRNLIDVRFPVQ